jgi:hypothetical protein
MDNIKRHSKQLVSTILWATISEHMNADVVNTEGAEETPEKSHANDIKPRSGILETFPMYFG